MKSQPKFKVCRRLGPGVYEKCQTQKFAVSESRKRGKRGGRRKQLSDFGLQLIEKQRVRMTYGVSEKQFRGYIKEATMKSSGNTTEALYKLLESRLDNTVFRIGLAPTRRGARQLVTHGHFMVNGRKVDIPSYSVKSGDVISIREGSRDKAPFRELVEKLEKYTAPEWVVFDVKKGEATVKGVPNLSKEQTPYDFGSVIEFYGR